MNRFFCVKAKRSDHLYVGWIAVTEDRMSGGPSDAADISHFCFVFGRSWFRPWPTAGYAHHGFRCYPQSLPEGTRLVY